MRAGSMDSTIVVQRSTSTIDAAGTPATEWTDLVTLRAQVIKASTVEYMRGAGATDETAVVFRTWYYDGITTADRIVCDGAIHNIKELSEIGRRAGLDIRTLALGEPA